jgi:hypothetical protein
VGEDTVSGPDPGPVDVVEVGAVPPYCRFKVLIRASLPVRHLTVRRNARRCSRAWRVLPAARLVAADENTVRDVIHAFNERGLAALAPRWAGGRPRRISERGHAEGDPHGRTGARTRRRLVLRSLRSGPRTLQRVRPNPPDPHARPRRKTTLRGVSARRWV